MVWKWISLFLFLVVVLLGSFFISGIINSRHGPPIGPGPNPDMGRGPSRMILDMEISLHLDSKQKADFRRIVKDYELAINKNRNKNRFLIDELDKCTMSASLDPTKALEISDQLEASEKINRNLTIKTFYKIKAILNDEQREIFKNILIDKKRHYKKIKKNFSQKIKDNTIREGESR